MYTVLRITGDASAAQTTVEAINAVRTGTLSARARDDGFAASITDSVDWSDHVRAIEAFIEAHRVSLADATARGASIQFDAMIESDDVAGHAYTSFGCPPSLHRELGAIGACLVFSWYATDRRRR
jgi:hypothetical protein